MSRELWEQFSKNPLEVYSRAAQMRRDAGFESAPTITQALEEFEPSEPNAPHDAFERMMKEAGIITRSDRWAGYEASNAGVFQQSYGTRALLAEFFRRTWLEASGLGRAQQRAIMLNDGVAGSWERPWAESQTVNWNNRIEAAIPLSELVANTLTINSNVYRGFYITFDAEQLRMFRVGESANIPTAKIVGTEREIRLHKYGRALQASYEDLAMMRVDKLAWIIRFMAVQSEVDKVAAALTVMVSGDGNANTAATEYEIASLDAAATTDVLTLKGWIAFRMKFTSPYMLTTALMREDVALQLALLNTGSANVPLASANLGGLGVNATPINATAEGVRYGWTSEAPAGKIVAFDRRMALDHLIMSGSQINETDRFILNQVQLMTMTEIEGFAVADPAAVKILDTVTP